MNGGTLNFLPLYTSSILESLDFLGGFFVAEERLNPKPLTLNPKPLKPQGGLGGTCKILAGDAGGLGFLPRGPIYTTIME